MNRSGFNDQSAGVLVVLSWVLSAVPSARILGGPDLHVDMGSTINLTCLIQFSPEPPAYIFWYHEDEVSGRKVIIHMDLLS